MVNRVLLRAGQIGVLAVLALLGLVDLTGGMRSSPLVLVQVLLAMAVAAVWLPLRPPGGRVLPAGAIAVSSVSSTGAAPGRVDSPPTSSRPAPSAIRRSACATAASTAW